MPATSPSPSSPTPPSGRDPSPSAEMWTRGRAWRVEVSTTRRGMKALEALTELVPFLRWRVGVVETGELVAAELVADPDRLAAVVAESGRGRGSEDPQVAASLWWQSYAYRVAGTTLAAWAVGGAALDPSALGTAIAQARHRPSAVVFDPAADTVSDLGDLVGRTLDGALAPMAEALRSRHALGPVLVRGNTMSSIASVLGAVAAAPGAPDLAERMAQLRAALPAALTATFVDGRRRACCLWWKTGESAGRLCADCSLDRAPGTVTP